jgi:hypothetical protein
MVILPAISPKATAPLVLIASDRSICEIGFEAPA